MGLTVFFAVFALMFVLGYPIAFTMIIGGIIYFLIVGINPAQLMDIMAVQLQAKDVLLAVPMFIFAANLMNDSEITDRIFGFVKKLMGPIRGGLGYANIITSIIFAGMSGSEIADVAGIGNVEIKAMKDEGYDGAFSCAVTCASATISPLIPPSIPMVIYASLTGSSIGYLFLAGFVPGLLLGGLEMVLCYYLSRKRNYPVGEVLPFGKVFRSFWISLPGLFAPVILLISIYTGVCTTTEAAALLVAYVLLVGFFVYRSLGIKKLLKIVVKSVENVGYISIMIAAAYVLSYIISRERVALHLTNYVLESGILTNKWMLLLFANILYFILGMFIDVSAIQLVVIPMLIPLLNSYGIDLIHFGAVTTMNLMMALDTPPYGQTGYITSAISGTPVGQVFKEMIKYWIPLEVFGLIVITYLPDLVLWLPRMFGYAG